MHPPSPTEGSAADPVEELLVACLALPEGEREPALERACGEHPELADELRARWRTLAALGLGVAPVAAEGFPEELGDFRLIERLGGGGMGVVYRAEQRSLGREVALKLMRPESLYFPKARERFRREVEAVARLEHPHIVPVHAVGEDQGVPFFAMPLLDGATLADVLAGLQGRAAEELSGADLARTVRAPEDARRAGAFALSWTDACAELARQVAEALQHAHERGLLHRDVKPSNVALTRDGRAQLFDFGLAVTSEVDRLTQTGGQLGTLQYMSPEQLRGERELDARSDVYALGVTLYELLGLRAAFEGPTRTAVEARILDGRPTPLRALNRRVPPELELVCAKAMDPDPARRYASARELANELRRVLQRVPVLARPPGTLLRARRWSQRHPALAVGLVAGVGLFVVGPSVLLWRERRHSESLRLALEQESRALEAERLARAAEQLALEETLTAQDFLEDLFVAASPYASGNPDIRLRDLLARGVEALGRLAGSQRLEGQLALSLAAAYGANALYAEALPLAQRALDIERALGAPLPSRSDSPVELVATSLRMLERDAEAETLLREELAREQDPERRARLAFALARTISYLGRLQEAAELLEAARDFYDDGAPQHREPCMAIDYSLSATLEQLGRHAEALELAEAGLALARELFPPDHPASAEGLARSTMPLASLGRGEEALEAQGAALDLITAFYGYGSFAEVRYREDLANLLARLGDFDEAARVAEEVVTHSEALFGGDHPRTSRVRRNAEALRARAGR